MNIDKIRKNYLSSEETQDRIQQVLKLVLQNCNPVSVILFGSAARTELTSSSDIDVVVVVQLATEMKPVRKCLAEHSGRLSFPVDFLVVDEETYQSKSEVGGVFFDAKHEGRVLYPGSPSLP